MKKFLAIAAAIIATFAFLPSSAEAGHPSVRLVGHHTCGAPIYATPVFAGYDSCGRPAYRWVNKVHNCRCHQRHQQRVPVYRPTYTPRYPSYSSGHQRYAPSCRVPVYRPSCGRSGFSVRIGF